ncbi:MAG: hypothetical protein WKF67_06925 [Rubrobacteraceae bacterium]
MARTGKRVREFEVGPPPAKVQPGPPEPKREEPRVRPDPKRREEVPA